MSDIERLLRQCAWQADKHFRKHGDLRSQIWLTVDRDGHHEFSETMCSAPIQFNDNEALDALCADMRADFADAGVTAYACAYPSRILLVSAGSAVLAQPQIARHHAITVEVHDAEGHCLLGVMDIVEIAGRQPALGPLLRNERATGSFGGLLDRRAA